MNPTDGMACATSGCANRGKPGLNIVGYGSFATKAGRRQRYRCTVCRGTLSTNIRGLRTVGFAARDGSSIKSQACASRAEYFCDGPSHGPEPQHDRALARTGLDGCEAAQSSMLRGFDLMELQAESSAPSAASATLSGSLQPSRSPPACGPGASWAAARDRNASGHQANVVRRGRVVGCPLIATTASSTHLGAVARLFGSCVRLWSSAQDTAEQSCCPGRGRVKVGTANRLKVALLASEDSETLNTSFVDAPQPHDSASVGVLAPALALPRPVMRTSSAATSSYARCHSNRPTAPGLAVRARNEDPSHAGWSGDQAIGPERHLHRAACHSARVCGDRRHCRGRVAAALMLVRTTSGGLINSERRKHPPPMDKLRRMLAFLQDTGTSVEFDPRLEGPSTDWRPQGYLEYPRHAQLAAHLPGRRRRDC